MLCCAHSKMEHQLEYKCARKHTLCKVLSVNGKTFQSVSATKSSGIKWLCFTSKYNFKWISWHLCNVVKATFHGQVGFTFYCTGKHCKYNIEMLTVNVMPCTHIILELDLNGLYYTEDYSRIQIIPNSVCVCVLRNGHVMSVTDLQPIPTPK